MTPLELITLIRGIDAADTDPGPDSSTPYIEIRRWVGEQNEIDRAAVVLIRALARERNIDTRAS